jgi:hypothetical protein
MLTTVRVSRANSYNSATTFSSSSDVANYDAGDIQSDVPTATSHVETDGTARNADAIKQRKGRGAHDSGENPEAFSSLDTATNHVVFTCHSHLIEGVYSPSNDPLHRLVRPPVGALH